LALGRAYVAIGDEDKGFSALQRATEATPVQAEAHMLLGDMYRTRGNYAEAVTAYHVYLKLAGQTATGLERLGDAYLEMGNVSTAAETYLQLVSLQPDRMVPIIKAARAYLRTGETHQAQRLCKQGLSVDPGNQTLHNLLDRATSVASLERP
ncbi:MAG: tetratricopeptide repeat protein, partial [Acidobacteriota bacterium]